MQASYRPVGGTWSTPVDLARGRQFVGPQVVVDPAGNATAVWRRVDADRSVVQTSTRPAGGTWSVPLDLSTDPSVDYSQRPTCRSSPWTPSGVVTSTWSRFEAATGEPWKFTAQSATRSTDGTWSAPVDLSPAGSPAKSTDVTVDPAGNATAVWAAGALPAGRHPTRGWRLVRPRPALHHRRPARQPRGRRSTRPAPQRLSGAASPAARYGVQSASRALGGAWTAPLDLTPRRGLRHSGDRRRPPGHRHRALAAARWLGLGRHARPSRATGGALGRPGDPLVARSRLLGPAGRRRPGAATPPRSGREPTGGRVIEAARRPAGGEWSEPVDLSDARRRAGTPRSRSTPPATPPRRGRARTARAGSCRPAASTPQVRSSPRSPAPRHASPVGPRPYSVKAYDAWSRVASARWTFPDGTTASGTSVSYAGDGSAPAPVRVVLTDSVGNATACTYTRTFTCRPTTRARADDHRPRPPSTDGRSEPSARTPGRRRRPRPRSKLSTDATVHPHLPQDTAASRSGW